MERGWHMGGLGEVAAYGKVLRCGAVLRPCPCTDRTRVMLLLMLMLQRVTLGSLWLCACRKTTRLVAGLKGASVTHHL